jgi:hypothetical protein
MKVWHDHSAVKVETAALFTEESVIKNLSIKKAYRQLKTCVSNVLKVLITMIIPQDAVIEAQQCVK